MDQAASANTSRRWKMFTAAVQPIEGNRRLRPTGLNVEVEVRGGGGGHRPDPGATGESRREINGESHKTTGKSWFFCGIPEDGLRSKVTRVMTHQRDGRPL